MNTNFYLILTSHAYFYSLVYCLVQEANDEKNSFTLPVFEFLCTDEDE